MNTYHLDTESQLDVYRLTPEGDVDPNYEPIRKIVPHSTYTKIADGLEDNNEDELDKAIKTDVKASRHINMSVPEDYEPEVFLRKGELQPIMKKEADESYSDTWHPK